MRCNRVILGMVPVFVLAAGVTVPRASVAAPTVDAELAFVVDVSGSIDTPEFNLEKQGYVNAFTNPAIVNAIQNGPNHQIAATLIYFSSNNEQEQAVPWTLISNTTSATAFANAISATSRPFAGLTAIGSAIDFTRPLFGTSGFSSNRLAMDISSDGSDNDSTRPVTSSRNDAVNAGITINGLAILTHEPDLVTYFQNNVIGGPNAFVTAASTTADFGTAISQKIFQEVTPAAVPEPSTFVMGGTAAFMGLGYGYWRRRRRQATA